ncbi:MAG: PQQ-dependent sugar dehydrogenase [Pseudomonadota bacterium]
MRIPSFGFALLATAIEAGAATCGGFPRLDVKTPDQFCVALLADKFDFPRGIQPLPNGDLIVVDMGSWEANVGSVWLLKPGDGAYQRTRLLNGLDRPNGIVLGPDGLVYVGVVGRIFRFDPRDPRGTMKDVIDALPGTGRHGLTTMRFDQRGDLFVNIGSASDHCEGADGSAPVSTALCGEAQGPNAKGVIRKYAMQWPAGTVGKFEVYAEGLRNSMALAFHPANNALWQADNARDAIQVAMPGLKNDNDLPHDELNLVRKGRHYGWPYCYDDNQASPEYPAAKCSAYQAPERLLPPHAAPLGMVFYTADQFPAKYKGSLVIGFHGYRQYGHRLVALLPDKKGEPRGRMVNLIHGWSRKPKQDMGAPVDVKLGPDGNIYLVEDRPGRVIRLALERP